MLTLYHNNQEIPLDTTEYYVRELASGLDEVIFDLSIWGPNYALMAEEENIVDRGGQRYLIKQIDAGAVTAKVVCQLDLDEWKAGMLVGYYSGSLTVAQQINAVKPTGWSVLDFSGASISRTIEGDYTPLQVCERCREVYSVYIRWDNKAKTCSIYSQQMGQPVGAFATRELNLKEINYKGKSLDFATRLYAYGKDGLSFATINDNKPYVDNNSYSDRIISAYWQDDRYTDMASLKAAAEKNLAKLAVPERSYDCAIIDLQATNPELYNNLDFSLFTAATLIDDVKGTAVDYQVIERHVWPYHPDRNDVIFNSSPVKIQNAVIQIQDEIENPQSTFRQIIDAEIDMVTDWLTDNNSHCYITQNEDGTIRDFIFVNGDQPIQTATQVMRINASGLGFSKTGVNGPYTNAFVFDSVLGGHLLADFITAGSMLADRIQGGTLESINSTTVDGVTYKNFSLDMKTGLLKALKLIIETPNFKLSEQGVVTATGASVNGTVTSENGLFKSGLNGGAIEILYNDTVVARIISDTQGNLTVKTGDPTQTQTLMEVYGMVECSKFAVYPKNQQGAPSGNPMVWVDGSESTGRSVELGGAASEVILGNFVDRSGGTIKLAPAAYDNEIYVGEDGISLPTIYMYVSNIYINGYAGATGNFETADNKTVSVNKGFVTGIY